MLHLHELALQNFFIFVCYFINLVVHKGLVALRKLLPLNFQLTVIEFLNLFKLVSPLCFNPTNSLGLLETLFLLSELLHLGELLFVCLAYPVKIKFEICLLRFKHRDVRCCSD